MIERRAAPAILMRGLRLGLGLGLRGIAACQPPAPPPGPLPPMRTTTSLDLETARLALTERLTQDGLEVEQRLGGLTVTGTDDRFTACAPIVISDVRGGNHRSRLTRPDRTTATAVVRIEAAGARTLLSWQASFSGSYLNRFDNLRFEAPCRSTGELERLLAGTLPN